MLAEGGEAGLEALKPHELACASPRVFWSVAYRFGDVAAGVKDLLAAAGADNGQLAALQQRARKLSLKALDNQAQQARALAEQRSRLLAAQRKASHLLFRRSQNSLSPSSDLAGEC